jgi:hypothetical protein
MIATLKPGGCVLAEEMDFVSVAPDPRLAPERRALFSRVIEAHNAVLARRHSFDPFLGRRIAGDLAGAGAVDIGCEGRVSMWHGGEAGGRVWELTLLQLREEMVASGLVAAEEVDAALELCQDQRLGFMSQITMAAWGHRPM